MYQIPTTETIEFQLDVGVRLDNDHFGSNESWNRADEWLRELSLEVVSAGSGFGMRDMQFAIPSDQTHIDWARVVKKRAEEDEIPLEYASVCALPTYVESETDITNEEYDRIIMEAYGTEYPGEEIHRQCAENIKVCEQRMNSTDNTCAHYPE